MQTLIEKAKSKVLSGEYCADNAAIFLDESGINVTNELYDELRSLRERYWKLRQGLQVGDLVVVRGINGAVDIKGNFRGYDADGRMVIFDELGNQYAHEKERVEAI
jgi:hypothetical protein